MIPNLVMRKLKSEEEKKYVRLGFRQFFQLQNSFHSLDRVASLRAAALIPHSLHTCVIPARREPGELK